jgi:hypothetical protein
VNLFDDRSCLRFGATAIYAHVRTGKILNDTMSLLTPSGQSDETQVELAKLHSVSVRTIKRWKRADRRASPRRRDNARMSYSRDEISEFEKKIGKPRATLFRWAKQGCDLRNESSVQAWGSETGCAKPTSRSPGYAAASHGRRP